MDNSTSSLDRFWDFHLPGFWYITAPICTLWDDLVAELGLAFFARDELESLQQVLAGEQRHAAAGHVDHWENGSSMFWKIFYLISLSNYPTV